MVIEDLSNGLQRDQWWLAVIGDTLVWARLREREAGTAEVLDCDGRILIYESPDSARAALMDAQFQALDGLDADDARDMGWDLDTLRPPKAGSDDALRRVMVVKRRP